MQNQIDDWSPKLEQQKKMREAGVCELQGFTVVGEGARAGSVRTGTREWGGGRGRTWRSYTWEDTTSV